MWREIQIHPEEAAVVAGDEEVVGAADGRGRGVDVEAADPAGAGGDDLQQGLGGEVVGADDALVRGEEDRLAGVEVGGLRGAAAFKAACERVLR